MWIVRGIRRLGAVTGLLEGYAVLTVAGNGACPNGLRQMLSARFNRGRRAETAVAAEPA